MTTVDNIIYEQLFENQLDMRETQLKRISLTLSLVEWIIRDNTTLDGILRCGVVRYFSGKNKNTFSPSYQVTRKVYNIHFDSAA